MTNGKTVIVNNTKLGLIGFEDIILMPGANSVLEETVKKMKVHPVISVMIEEGTLEFPEISEEKGISELSQGEAVDLVTATTDVSLLESWKESDKRKQVLKAIDEQLKKLAAPTVLRSDKK